MRDWVCRGRLGVREVFRVCKSSEGVCLTGIFGSVFFIDIRKEYVGLV